MIAYIVSLLYYTVQRRFLRKPFCWMSNYWIYISYLATLLVSFSLFHPWCDVAALSIQCSHASCGGAKFKTGCRERLFCFFAAWSQAVSTRKMCIGRKFAENMKYFLFLDSRCLLVCYSRPLFWINMLPSMDYMTVCLNFCITCIFSIY